MNDSVVVNVATPLTASCTTSAPRANNTAGVGETVTYTARAIGGSGTYTYRWDGTEGLTGTGSVVNKSYSVSGAQKSAQVSVTSSDNPLHQVIATCPSVMVSAPAASPNTLLSGMCITQSTVGGVYAADVTTGRVRIGGVEYPIPAVQGIYGSNGAKDFYALRTFTGSLTVNGGTIAGGIAPADSVKIGVVTYDGQGVARIQNINSACQNFERTAPTIETFSGPTSFALGQLGQGAIWSIVARKTSQDLVSYSINWGDGSTPTTGSASGALLNIGNPHTYTASGTYTLRAEVRDSGGNMTFRTTTVTITPASTAPLAPTIETFSGPNTLSTGQSGTWTLTATKADQDLAGYLIDWGDGTRITGFLEGASLNVTRSHTYSTAGTTYTLRAEVSDSNGDGATKTTTVVVSRPLVCGSLGDVNSDGFISRSDITFFDEYRAGSRTLTPAQIVNADVNKSGDLSIVDRVDIDDYINGEASTLSGCTSAQTVSQLAAALDGAIAILQSLQAQFSR